ncbi:hypothetical protein BO71DRAFT_402224 [Aspergillus ellipticus CBS 707.79]|uniref:Secreted protein n=1 Tax=Aspergillus ellipticus CBS 707.79 TaxID=1448320 RepID=A0A319D089_9EURO|nr:hypothetical protein BO71DRAFT_402224 [Aspergillus ellipticus CBS 707.79]
MIRGSGRVSIVGLSLGLSLGLSGLGRSCSVPVRVRVRSPPRIGSVRRPRLPVPSLLIQFGSGEMRPYTCAAA